MLEKIISKYKLIRKIGQGNSVILYKAYNINNVEEKIVANVFDKQDDKNIIEQFKKLSETLSSIDHPNIVKVLEFHILENHPVFITKLLDGQNLKFAVLIKGLNAEQNLSLFKQILNAIDYLHQHKIVHRDIKPENVFLVDNYKKVKILNPGIAKIIKFDHPSKIGKRLDAPMFLSPEQASGADKIDYRSDIYSLGVLLYFIISRKLPFSNTSSYNQILQQIINDPVPLIPVKDKINKIIQKATAKNPDERFQNVSEFIEAVKSL